MYAEAWLQINVFGKCFGFRGSQIRPVENVVAYSIEQYVINNYNSITETFIKELVRRIQYAE